NTVALRCSNGVPTLSKESAVRAAAGIATRSDGGLLRNPAGRAGLFWWRRLPPYREMQRFLPPPLTAAANSDTIRPVVYRYTYLRCAGFRPAQQARTQHERAKNRHDPGCRRAAGREQDDRLQRAEQRYFPPA